MKYGRDTEHDHCWHHRPEAPSLCCICEDVTEQHAEMRQAELERLGIDEEEIEKTRFPTCWPI